MTNKEKYGNKIIDIAIRGGSFAVVNGKPLSEGDVNCIKCAFFKDKDCVKAREAWLNSEYVEPPVDWSKVAVDTPILVRDNEGKVWRKSRASKMNGYRSMISRQKNDVFKFKPKKKKKG